MLSTLLSDSLVLNVDDNDGARYAKGKILSRAGMNVIEASSGGEAMERALAEQPDLILLDTRLPDINGFEVCRRLKADPATAGIIILQTSSSYLKVSDKIIALEGGADNYLFEPMEPEELVANVKALLRLSKVERALRDVDRRKDEFLATLAHELRNPLAPIRSAVALLEALTPNASPGQIKAHQIILRQTDHMVRLVEDLLDVSRITQGKIALQVGPVEVQAFVRSAIETSMPLIDSRRHHFELVLPPSPVWLEGDPVRLVQVLGNLLHNAAKFTPPGGRIMLHVAVADGQLQLHVGDNGIGMSPASLKNIFELFAQEGHAGDRVQDGLGIGLSLVRKLVEMHEGTIEASSDGLGLGSLFVVRLPGIFSDAVAAPRPDVDSPAMVGNAARILVVDDNHDAAETLADLLTMYGHEVRMAATGRAALASAATFLPDIVFLDIGLPGQDGYEIAALLRAMPALAGVALYALTGYGSADDKQRAMDAGFDKHFVKPLDFAQLDILNHRVVRSPITG